MSTVDEPSTFFLHVFNNQMHRNYSLNKRFSSQQLALWLDVPLKLVYLASTERLLIPTIDLVESPVLLLLLPSLQPLIDHGALQFCGSAVDPEEFLRRKQRHFSGVRLYPEYFEGGFEEKLHSFTSGMVARTVRTTSDIARRWRSDIESSAPDSAHLGGRLLAAAYNNLPRGDSKIQLAETLYALPDVLSGEALLWEVAERRGYIADYSDSPIAFPLRLLLAQEWLLSHINEYNASLLVNIPGMGSLDCGLSVRPGRHPACVDFSEMARWFDLFGLADALRSCSFEDLIRLKQSGAFRYFRTFWWRTFAVARSATALDAEMEAEMQNMLGRSRWAANRRKLVRTGGYRYLDERIHAVCETLSRYDRENEMGIHIRSSWLTRSINISTGNIVGGSNVIAVTDAVETKKSGIIMGDEINISTGDISNSPGAVAVKSSIGNINAAIGDLGAHSNPIYVEIAQISTELKNVIEQQSVLSFQATLAALQDLELVISAAQGGVPVESEKKPDGPVRSALARLSKVAQQLEPVFATMSTLVLSLAQLLGLG